MTLSFDSKKLSQEPFLSHIYPYSGIDCLYPVMSFIFRCVWHFALMMFSLATMCGFSDCYDPLDPNGNITIMFDIIEWRDDGYVARVTLQNFYMYRHVDNPGWQLGWTWARDEVIWSMSGAFATQQGNCSSFKTQTPHSCKKDPVIADLMVDALPEDRYGSCCRGGLLTSLGIKPATSYSSFQVIVGNLESNTPGYNPLNLTLKTPGAGYTCGPVVDTEPTISSVIGGRRQEQVFKTWTSTCTYSPYLANKTPKCCVSLSTFYNPAITPCPQCSCGCKPAAQSKSCMRGDDYSIVSRIEASSDMVQCTDHMCPIRVHWHFMSNYKDHWRVKLTLSNYNYARKYPDWNVLVQHPGFRQSMTTFSFNNTILQDEVALFWGLENLNNDLLNANLNQLGYVTTEILLKKDDSFTIRNGWVFPRKIYINGEECQMPLPDNFPMLPNYSPKEKPPLFIFMIPIIVHLCLYSLN